MAGRGRETARLEQAVADHRAGRLDTAERIYRQVLATAPNHPDVLHLLSLLLRHRGDPGAAAPFAEKAVRTAPRNADARTNLATILRDLGRPAEAEAAFRAAIEIRPDHVEALCNLGAVLRALGRPDEAAEWFRRASGVRPDLVVARRGLGAALFEADRVDEAVVVLRAAAVMAPGDAEVLNDLGVALRRTGDVEAAVDAFRRAIAIAPGHAWAWDNLGNLLLRLGDFDGAEAAHGKAVAAAPGARTIRSNRLLAMQYRPGITAAELARAHADWPATERIEAPPRRRTNGPLRVGFVSADLRQHPVGWFLLPLLEHHDRSAFEAICYQDGRADAVTERLRAGADVWRDVRGATTDALATTIRDDNIDILVDLAGHTARNRMPLFDRRPAPVQMTWAGYVGTTGLATMDVLLADRIHVPEGEEGAYRETVVRMPDGYVCYRGPDYAPEPARADGPVTFGAFHNPAKINPVLLDVWATILQRVPESRLLFKYAAVDVAANVARITAPFAARGIDPARLVFEGPVPHRDFLADYGRVDVLLDSFPYSGGLTTCESLWMGVPVVTLTGRSFAGRHATGHLTHAGFAEWVARDVAGYVETAVALAAKPPMPRGALRARVAASPLCDGARFARNFETMLRKL